MPAESHRSTEEPQRVDGSRADAEWKANPGLGSLIHDADEQVSLPYSRLVEIYYS